MVDEIGSAVVGGIFWMLLESRLGWLITISLLAGALYIIFFVYFTGGVIFTASTVGLMALQISGAVKLSRSRKESSIND
ncbi:MAG: hypothetical protein ACR2PF_11455 [Rhizobiaceae bacterium]